MNKVTKVIHRKLGKEVASGLAFCDTGEIHIDSRLKGVDHLETVVHEVMHILQPKWSEIRVIGNSKELTRILWELGYRRIDV